MQAELAGDDFLQRQIDGGRHIAHQRDPATLADTGDGGANGIGGADAFDGEIGIADAGGVAGVDGIGGAEFAGDLQAGVVEIDGDDALASVGSEGLHGEEADHSCADHDAAGAVHLAGQLDGVDGHRDGFDESGLFVAQLVRKAVDDAARDGDEFGEGAVAAVGTRGNAKHLAVVAEVDLASKAERAAAAVDGGIESHAIAGLKVVDIAAGLGDFAGGFVSHDEGRDAAAGRAIQAVHVAAADAAGANADEHFVGGGLGARQIDDFEGHVLLQEKRFHGDHRNAGGGNFSAARAVGWVSGGRSVRMAVFSRRNFAMLAQVASLLATALIVPAMAHGPHNARTVLELFESALLVSLVAFGCCFLLAFWLHAAIARVERVDVVRATLQTSAAAIWFAPATILMSSLSPLFLPAALALVVNATRLLYSEWRQVHPEGPSTPQPLVVPLDWGWIGAGELGAPMLPHHFGPALTVSVGLQAGFAALLLHHELLGAAFFAMGTAVLTVFLISAGVWQTARRPSLPRNIFGVGLTIVLSAMLIVAGMTHGDGSWGWGLGSGSGDTAGTAGRPAAPVPAPGGKSAAARARRELPPLPPDGPPLPGSFPGVILWPEVQPVTMLVEPVPSTPGGLAGMRRPFSIPFGGEYWMFRFLYDRPPRGSYFRRGNPADLAFSTTDRWPLQMEAHQKLEKAIDLACCSGVQIDIRNADRFPNTVSLELIVIDGAHGGIPTSLGTAAVRSSPNLAATPVVPVGETLNFAVPPRPSLVFDEFKVVFHRVRNRADRSARIAIDRFVLVPRGSVVADPM